MCHHKKLNIYLLYFSSLSFFSIPLYAKNVQSFVNSEEGSINEGIVRYVETGGELRALTEDKSTQDAKDLGNSIEFEVYRVDENSSSRSVFVSAAGICKGFNGDYGVDFTNFTNHYISRNDDSQYYGGITGASIYRKHDPNNMQYVPIYAIKNHQLEKEIREREMKKTKDIVREKIYTGEQLLNKTICKAGKK
ncbi:MULTISPECIES: hypothetical protein [Pasteurellaceae]|uniref:DUF8095 domain-containing protein n=1 Tax=Rodentibacter genomosp. 1 TaxID=1908264 RepID=A0A1V3J5U1_9PAST|nr:hypothetical protein [Rodentibacter genomosp. 1]MBF0751640.1 hypothetical protein [Pasteurella sp. 19428wF3_WM03]OOF50596.1 hypothetical protein BKK54_05785 [Rodentibacter genomosp. 1]TFU51300.1 hypothetical protein E4T92_05700 [Pasteurella sp. WM03]